ncbi:ATP-binding protein [Desulfovibrio ferrophilus]|uniref:histidine kinase n=1 Tax=Desulfovibrio ferrophilus TaxID=241368 RepID=A0A2Z6B3I0_9BACT|nr:ATP-binding protein [Desulfovibrio ferrophilus]BBD10013.1 signal transduction histidine kinase, nitrogen specific, NtrB [Desulfovibrio ferrophilus]
MKRLLLACLAVTVLLVSSAWASGGAEAPETSGVSSSQLRANILILNSYHYGYPWSDEIVRGLREGFSPFPGIELQVEYMDFKRYELAHLAPLLVDLYARKFSDKKFDLIVVSDNNAFSFIRQYGELLFPGLPVIFCGVNDFDPALIEGRNITGIVENYDVGDTLELALNQHPGKKRLVVIGDRSNTGTAIMNQVKQAESQFANRLSFEYWTKYDLDEIMSRAAQADDDTFFYFIPFYTEINGRFYSAQQLLDLVYQSTVAPIYSSWEFLLGHGIVGGKLLSGEEHGRQTAALSMRIITGESAADIPVITKATTLYRFDYDVLVSQGIPVGLLPEGSTLINEPKAFYELDKQVFWTIMVSFMLLLVTTVFLYFNIIRRRAVELRMQDQLSFQEILMDTIPHLVCWKDRQLNYLGANRYFMEFFGVADPARKTTIGHIVSPLHREFIDWTNRLDRRVVLSEKPLTGLKRGVPNAAGEQRQLEIKKVPLRDKSGGVVGTLTTAEDVTRAANLEKQLLQSQKMEAIGTLAGGIAHDFNNILTSIINSTELALMDVDGQTPAGQDLERSLKAAQRGSGLVKQILTFSRPSKEGFAPIKIQGVVSEAVALLRASLPRNIQVETHVTEDLPLCVADPNQINQILMNLCTNAFQAMRETGGHLSVSLGEVGVWGDDAEIRNIEPGRYVKLTVADSGPGISPEVVDKIFDPFFTTKGKAEGTGLGLAVVLGIVRGHRGSIEVESSPGHTAFTALFPEALGDEVQPVTPILPEFIPGAGHLLFVEDDEDQYETIPRVLETLGYSVTPARNAAEALEIVAGDPDGFDLVITDFDMPGLNGLELARRLAYDLPGVPVVMITGRERAVDHASALDNVSRIVLKPYDRNTIAQAIREVLTNHESRD